MESTIPENQLYHGTGAKTLSFSVIDTFHPEIYIFNFGAKYSELYLASTVLYQDRESI